MSAYLSLTVEAVHLQLVSNLTSESFIACLCRFISRRGYPSQLWSDHGTNYVGAKREIKELVEFLGEQKTQKSIYEFVVLNTWNGNSYQSILHTLVVFGRQQSRHKTHLKHVIGKVKLTYEEMTTVLTQIEACLNSRRLVPVD